MALQQKSSVPTTATSEPRGMLPIRRAAERGRTLIDWLDSRHTFSFGGYHDPRFMGFSDLRVINEDRVRPGAGFGTHPHRDMEILSWVLEGAMAHRDSTGNGGVIRPGELQRMSAGTGVTHSEMNASQSEPLHFLQIWLLPERRGLPPSYEQRAFAPEALHNRWRLVASHDGREGSLTIHQDASLAINRLDAGRVTERVLAPRRRGWLQVARGSATIDGAIRLDEGDGAAWVEPVTIAIRAEESAELLWFDLAE